MTAKNGIHAAFVKAQAEMTNPKKGSDNPFFKSKYADLTSCWLACKDALAEHDIGVMQGVYGDLLRTTIIHSSGETISDEGIPLLGYKNAKNPAQALGASMTYARRYGLCSMLGMAPEDDDGNSLAQDDAPVQLLTDDQVTVITDLINEVDADRAAFCKYLGVKDVPNINQKQYDVAVAALEKKRAA
jgi:hypothetical protein